MRHRRGDPVGAALAGECEAFLAGAYADHLVDQVQVVPAWAWLNLLAHGTEDQVREAATTFGARGWPGARRCLAGELIDIVDSGLAPLDLLQRACLVPLELELAARPSAMRWSPAQLVAAVLDVLPQRRAAPEG